MKTYGADGQYTDQNIREQKYAAKQLGEMHNTLLCPYIAANVYGVILSLMTN
jgi:hypothetical protein